MITFVKLMMCISCLVLAGNVERDTNSSHQTDEGIRREKRREKNVVAAKKSYETRKQDRIALEQRNDDLTKSQIDLLLCTSHLVKIHNQLTNIFKAMDHKCQYKKDSSNATKTSSGSLKECKKSRRGHNEEHASPIGQNGQSEFSAGATVTSPRISSKNSTTDVDQIKMDPEIKSPICSEIPNSLQMIAVKHDVSVDCIRKKNPHSNISPVGQLCSEDKLIDLPSLGKGATQEVSQCPRHCPKHQHNESSNSVFVPPKKRLKYMQQSLHRPIYA